MKPRPTAPDKPKTPINAKALNAYASELRRYERKLVEWEADLEAREADLDTAMTENWAECGEDEDAYAPEVCECTPLDAKRGCDCEQCVDMRADETDECDAKAAAGDEVQFLERLFELKDKRK
jgi:hypothetical protein